MSPVMQNQNEKFSGTPSPARVSLVKGYLPIFPIPAGVPGNWHKFEIIQHTSLQDTVTLTSLDYDLNLEILRALLSFFNAASFIIETESGRKFIALEPYCAWLLEQKKIDESLQEEELDCFKTLSLRDSSGKPFLHLLLREDLTGGPSPYHDAWWYELYFSEECTPALQNHFLAIFMKKKIFIEEILQGAPHPEPPPLLPPILSRLWRKFLC